MDNIRKTVTAKFLVNELKHKSPSYGYDIWIGGRQENGTRLWRCAVEILKAEPPAPYVPPNAGGGHTMTYGGPSLESAVAEEIFPLALDILWQLCLHGLLRPGISTADGQSVEQGIGYSLTQKGKTWITTCSDAEINELCAGL